MKIILPPSETKVSGGSAGSLLLSGLAFPQLTGIREEILDAVESLAADPVEAARVLKLGPTQADEVQRNRELRSSPTMRAIQRYTGVLFDAIDYDSLDARSRRFLGAHTVIHSALFGLIAAGDMIPAYRLSYNSQLFGRGRTLKQLWQAQNAAVLGEMRGLVLDLRSNGYVSLGPLPKRDSAITVTVMSRAADGSLRSLNHFNKKGKGELVRALALLGRSFSRPDALVAALRGSGLDVSMTDARTLRLVVDSL